MTLSADHRAEYIALAASALINRMRVSGLPPVISEQLLDLATQIQDHATTLARELKPSSSIERASTDTGPARGQAPYGQNVIPLRRR